MEVGQKQLILELLTVQQTDLENTLYHCKSAYEKRDLKAQEKDVVIYRMKKYFDSLLKVKDLIAQVEKSIDAGASKIEISRQCKRVIELTSFVVEDSRDVINFLIDGIFLPSAEKDALH